MGKNYAKNGSLKKQVVDRLNSKAAYGQKKHLDKLKNQGKPALDKIYSSTTMRNYQNSAVRFIEWAKDQGCYSLEEARALTGQYLQERMDQGKSAWTVRLDAAALGKLYQVQTTELGVDLPTRHRADVTQHRTRSWRGHFSEDKHRDLVEFCRSTGLRRCEVLRVRPEDVEMGPDNRITVHVERGKGGKTRDVRALTDAPWRLAEAARADGRDRLFESIPHRTPCHEYRAQYAQELYTELARDPATLPKKERYCAQADRAGQWYDREAMQIVSNNLGHARLDVVMNYLK